ncbi:hypothetical protein RD792_013870 [Penstemon davidsonii]|uniref:Bifunctional inhibitor/plant lipid transfer protein/seed storage helical domain-containing protein n=1 Tax=Penstemon davidsonii TaxID=160366 RepID=A0ABR0CPL4_9LAMI|nr:hypothetical protein RD792_013870 [Penstemon davidsonii]
MGKSIILWLVLLFGVSSHAEEAAMITCNTVVNSLTSCLSYVFNGGAPPPECCNGARSIYNQAKAEAAAGGLQALCSCLKSLASLATPDILANSAALPRKCGIPIPYQISPSIDCSRYRTHSRVDLKG